MNISGVKSYLPTQATQKSQQTQESHYSEMVSTVLEQQVTTQETTPEATSKEMLEELSLKSFSFTLPGMDLKETNEELMRQLQSGVKSFLNKHGFDSTQDIKLETGYDGRLFVTNGHPDSAEINQLLENEPELQQLFTRISANESLFAAVQRHLEFSKAYESDPARAVEQFQDLFNENAPQKVSRITLSNGEISHRFVNASPGFSPSF